MQHARFSGSGGGLTMFATRTTCGHELRAVVPRMARRRETLSPHCDARGLTAPFRESSTANDEPMPMRAPKGRTAPDRSDRAKVRHALMKERRRIPCSSRIAHPSVARTAAPGWNSREARRCAPGDSNRDLSRAEPLVGPQSRDPPRRGPRSHGNRGAFGRRAPRRAPGLPRARPSGAPVHAAREPE